MDVHYESDLMKNPIIKVHGLDLATENRIGSFLIKTSYRQTRTKTRAESFLHLLCFTNEDLHFNRQTREA